jgi:hypothetical protein
MATATAAAAAAKEAKPQTPPPAPSATAAAGTKKPLYLQYPLSSTWEIVLTNDETITGEVYCTDPIADVVVLQDPHSSETIRVISMSSIRDSKQIKEPKDEPATATNGNGYSKKAMEEREKRAIRLAQESFRHLNAKVGYSICIKRHSCQFFACELFSHPFAISFFSFFSRLLPRDK